MPSYAVLLMRLHLDEHRNMKGVTAAAVAEAHAKDLKVQGKHDLNHRSYWVDEKNGGNLLLGRSSELRGRRVGP